MGKLEGLLLATLIENRSVMFTALDVLYAAWKSKDDSDIDAVIERLVYQLTRVGLTIHNVRVGSLRAYVITPILMTRNTVQALVDVFSTPHGSRMLAAVVSKVLETGTELGPALVFTKIAEAWGVELRRKAKKLCAMRACIYKHEVKEGVYYYSFSRNAPRLKP